MGHIRLGELPRTRKWLQVVNLLEGGAGVAQLANATMRAAEQGLKFAAKDKGLVETMWLLTQIPLAAKAENFGSELRKIGMNVSDQPSLVEIVGAFADAVDARLSNNNGRTDLGEMAQNAAAETISDIIGSQSGSLFESNASEAQNQFARLTTQKNFSNFSRSFFARLTNKCLDYFLGRAYAHHVGEGRRFTTLAQQSEFKEALQLHCRQASVIVEEFSGGWYSKTKYEKGGVTRNDAAGFAHVAMRKLVAELKAGAEPDGE